VESERIPPGVAARLSRYLQILTQTRKAGRSVISSHSLSEYAGVNPTQIRRDLSSFGRFGKRGVGYDVDHLISSIREILHTSGRHNVGLVGGGKLGSAIAASDIFPDHGFRIVAVFDVDPALAGKNAGGVRVYHVSDLKRVVEEKQIIIGVLAVPADAAQGCTDKLARAGVRIILNYSDALVESPPGASVHPMSPAGELLYALHSYLS